MEDLHIALAQGHWAGTQAATKALYQGLVGEAAATGARLICLPEFSILPYFPGVRDEAGLRWAEPLQGGVGDQFISGLAREHSVSVIGSILEVDENGGYWDTATIHGPGGALRAFTRKMHIPAGDGYHETDYFEGYHEFPVHDIGTVKLAAPTCYDQWFPELARIYALEGAELIYYPTAIGSEPTASDFDSGRRLAHGHARACGGQRRIRRRLQSHWPRKCGDFLWQQLHL